MGKTGPGIQHSVRTQNQRTACHLPLSPQEKTAGSGKKKFSLFSFLTTSHHF
jgi:hypothetical protein